MPESSARRAGFTTTFSAERLLWVYDMSGTSVFAIEGATAGIAAGLDVLGVLVLGFVTALAGGTIRDVLIGAIPPQSVRDWRYAAVAFTSAASVYFFSGTATAASSSTIVYFDAAGLGLFAVAGAQKSLAYGIHPLIAIVMGGVTGAGGGVIGDVLLARVPAVLHTDVYASAALAGAAAMILGRRCGLNQTLAGGLGIVVCIALRVVSVQQHWSLHGVPRW